MLNTVLPRTNRLQCYKLTTATAHCPLFKRDKGQEKTKGVI